MHAAGDQDSQPQVAKKLNIFTARPAQLSQANFGFESPKTYQNIARHSYNLSYKHIAKAYSEMWAVALSGHGGKKLDSSFMSKVVKTEWLGQIESMLEAAKKVAACISVAQENVLIYCPSGGAGTPLLSSLA